MAQGDRSWCYIRTPCAAPMPRDLPEARNRFHLKRLCTLCTSDPSSTHTKVMHLATSTSSLSAFTDSRHRLATSSIEPHASRICLILIKSCQSAVLLGFKPTDHRYPCLIFSQARLTVSTLHPRAPRRPAQARNLQSRTVPDMWRHRGPGTLWLPGRNNRPAVDLASSPPCTSRNEILILFASTFDFR